MKIAVVCIVAVAVIAAIVAAWCKIAGRGSREEEKAHPCSWCQRWGECNGVDDACPWRCDDG